MSEKHSALRSPVGVRLSPPQKGEGRSLAEEVRQAFNSSQQQKPQKSAPEAAQPVLRKRGLGRGLGALFSSTVVSVTPPAEAVEVQVNEVASAPVVARAEVIEVPEAVAQAPVIATPIAVEPTVIEAHAPVISAAEYENVQSMQSAPSATPASEDASMETLDALGSLRYVPVSSLTPNPDQPRQYFNDEELLSLATSIKESGLLQPILVRENSKINGLEIIAGERRWRAAMRAGLELVPVILRDLSDREALEIGIIENVQRANLNPIEEAEAYQRLIDDFGQTQAEIAETVGKDRTSIANMLRLLKLGRVVRDMIVSGELSAGHGRALLMVATEEQQVALARRIIKEGLSVRATERAVNEPEGEQASEKVAKGAAAVASPTTQALEERLRRGLGTKVKVAMRAKEKGEIRISFFSTEELESLLERLDV